MHVCAGGFAITFHRLSSFARTAASRSPINSLKMCPLSPSTIEVGTLSISEAIDKRHATISPPNAAVLKTSQDKSQFSTVQYSTVQYSTVLSTEYLRNDLLPWG